jgi:hypothetical protein
MKGLMWPLLGISAANFLPLILFFLTLVIILRYYLWSDPKAEGESVPRRWLQRLFQFFLWLFIVDVSLTLIYFVTSGATPHNILLNFLPVAVFVLGFSALLFIARRLKRK